MTNDTGVPCLSLSHTYTTLIAWQSTEVTTLVNVLCFDANIH